MGMEQCSRASSIRRNDFIIEIAVVFFLNIFLQDPVFMDLRELRVYFKRKNENDYGGN